MMLNKVLYKMALDKDIASLRNKPDHSEAELDAIAKGMPVADMKDSYRFADYCRKNSLSLKDCMILLAWVFAQKAFLDDIKASGSVSYTEACQSFERARINTIVIHRVNYIFHEAVIEVYDILERDGRLRLNTKKAVSNTERIWDKYYSERKTIIEKTAWFTLQDHLRLVSDSVRMYLDKVYEAIRDNMIQKGFRDVEIKARCMVALLLGRVMVCSFKAFFRDFEQESGVDYSRCFANDDLSLMLKNFAMVCDSVGLRTKADGNGCYSAVDYNPEGCQRFKWAWKDFISALRDDDLMDEAAKNAIGLNPEVQKEYEQVLKDEESRQLAESVGVLSEKFKVSSI